VTRVYQALAGAISDAGIDTVFCVLGDGNLDLMVELAERHDVRLVHARHEQGATAMADGYARRSGRLGVCSVTHGPGLTQTATSLRVAVAHASRLLLLAGDTPTGDPHHIQSLRQAPYVESLGARHVALRTPGRWRADLAEALAGAAAGHPTVFGAPTDLQMADAGPDAHTSHFAQAPPGAPGITATATADSGLADAVALLAAAKAPVIVAGRGASSATTELLALAEALAAPLVTTLGANGLAAGHAQLSGLIGGLGAPAANATLHGADCVLVVGASLNPWSTRGGTLLAGERVIQIDTDRLSFGRFLTPAVALWGDARATLSALAARLPAVTGDPGRTPPRPDRHASPAGAADADADRGTDPGDGGPIDPRRVFAVLDAALPRRRTLVLDGGHFITFACNTLGASAPERFIFSCDFATIGQGLAMATGAAVAAPADRTTLIVGDGGFLMSIAELDTAVRYRLPLNIVVVNDGAYGQEVHSLAAKGLPTHHAVFDVPDLGGLGRAYGADGHLISEAAELDRLPAMLTAAGGPRVIDIRVDPAVVSEAASEIFRQVREAVPA
jgi:thiamine pyrophosphate-dependent acetolactate synthase large subunit-like protein